MYYLYVRDLKNLSHKAWATKPQQSSLCGTYRNSCFYNSVSILKYVEMKFLRSRHLLSSNISDFGILFTLCLNIQATGILMSKFYIICDKCY